MKVFRISVLLAVLLSVLAIPSGANAQPNQWMPDQGDKVVFGSDFTLREGEVLDGDLISFGGNVVLEIGSVVDGDLVSFGGRVESEGTVSGDFIAFGSRVTLAESALIEGSLALMGSDLNRAEGSQIDGDVVTDTLNIDVPEIPEFPGTIEIDPEQFGNNIQIRRGSGTGNFGNRIIGTMFVAFAMATTAMLAVLFLPKQAGRVRDAVLAEPVAAGGLSLVSFAILPVLLVVLSITVILIPVALLLVFLVALALVFGWIAIGIEVGDRIVKAIDQDWSLPVRAGAGTFVLSFGLGLIGVIPCIGWLASFLMVLLSFGGVVLTRFGTQEYPMSEEPVDVAKPATKKAKKSTAKKGGHKESK